ncbi:MAG: 16S rRNA (uracil(1498)-N(3))-methyltransferase [Gracilimonas sp.]|uniref:RsmE family RNA methyltransferase n=1 Tax=Gracilimonas sp. TaxID=1974203 RepID=UPI0019AA3CDF|nr:RsmE family RNA methyltransferase [Gracilimonas sp.]MBD3616174.1 16S rRNA (uracil(1498)-N(3))-methyltransferase [Gracilimonas sp.]
MDNVFFTEPGNIYGNQLELEGQEARHAAKVLRFNIGDQLFASDGKGNRYRTKVTSISKNSVLADIEETTSHPESRVKKVLAFGAIKKRDRLEFAVEKAVELDAWEICVFDADHSERSRVNEERLRSIVLSAFKQSKRYWLPKVVYKDSLDEVFKDYQGFNPVMAHMEVEENRADKLNEGNNLLLVGPEGGFSDREIELAKENGTAFISLGKYRLRAETAVTAILSQFLFTR